MARLFFIIVNLIIILHFSSATYSGSTESSSTTASSSDDLVYSTTATSATSGYADSDAEKQVKCKANEVYSNCTQSLCRRLKCSDQGKAVPQNCGEVAQSKCKRGCVCEPGYLKTAKGKCVPESQCYGKLVCADSEIVNTCPKQPRDDYCPKSENERASNVQVKSSACRKPLCTCRFNFKRDRSTNKCIPARNCPPFNCSRPKEEFNACPPYCPTDSCSQATPTGRCPLLGRIGIVVECKPSCRCVEGYWRDNNNCVPYLACPGKCPANERFSSCIQAECRALNCTQKDKSIACPRVMEGSCKQGCVCNEGFLRLDNGTCVPEDKCTVVCPANEEFSTCTQEVCRELNCSQRGKPLACVTSGKIAPGCCESGCVCQSGYLRTAEGDCIPEKQCYGDLVCKDKEVANTCSNHSFDDRCLTCEEETEAPFKVISEPCAEQPVCSCEFNYRRALNGTCIPAVDCPSFECSGINEEYNPCPPICPSEDCSQATPTGRCPLGNIGIINPCRPSCRCISGYWRNNGVCVPYAECPGKCSVNEEFSDCAQAICRAEKCEQRGQPIACPLIAEGFCEKRCVCVQGTLRNEDGICVPEDQCPVPICGENEFFNECPGGGCAPINCPESYKEEQTRLADCVSPAVCFPSECTCLKNYRRDSTGKCIYIGECPGICPSNEKFSNCTSPTVAEDSCTPGCVCKKGTSRDKNGKCVPKKSQDSCGENEFFNGCPRSCASVKCPKSYKEEQAWLADCNRPAVCRPPRCNCIKNYRRDSNGKCIYIGECPGICPANEEFSNCTSPTAAIYSCTSGCVCKKGTSRDKNGNCVPEESQGSCGENEFYNGCPGGCAPVNCPKSYKEEQAWLADCFSTDDCRPPRCDCLKNYRRDSNGKCIYIGECPGICPKNEEFSNCTTSAIAEDSTGCVCKKGTVRDKQGNCVPKDQPPPQCGTNEVRSCVHECPPETTCRTRGIQYSCITPTKKCEDKCICKPGYYRNPIGDCITEKQCEQCDRPNEFFSCGFACDNVCTDLDTQNRTSCPILNIVCNPKCYCEDGFARDSSNQCIPVEKCPKNKTCTGPNEKHVKCKQTCPSELCKSIVSRIDCSKEPPCQPGCACKSGFFRQNETSPCLNVCECSEMKGTLQCSKKNY